MEFELPVLDHDRLVRAAEAMIANYGKNALAEAIRRTRDMRFAGCDSTAVTWDCICKIIRAHFGVNALTTCEGASNVLEPEKLHQETAKFSFFEIQKPLTDSSA